MRDLPHTPPLPTVPLRAEVAFTDVSAAALRFTLDHDPITPLASRFVDVPAGTEDPHIRLELRVIGSSHQVIVDDDFIETFACLGAGEAPDWGRERSTDGTWAGFSRHRFTCTLTEVPGDFAAAAAEVVRRSGAHDDHLVVSFPGDPSALTALALTRVDPDRLAWQTWHCYPQHRQIVHSHSELRRDA